MSGWIVNLIIASAICLFIFFLIPKIFRDRILKSYRNFRNQAKFIINMDPDHKPPVFVELPDRSRKIIEAQIENPRPYFNIRVIDKRKRYLQLALHEVSHSLLLSNLINNYDEQANSFQKAARHLLGDRSVIFSGHNEYKLTILNVMLENLTAEENFPGRRIRLVGRDTTNPLTSKRPVVEINIPPDLYDQLLQRQRRVLLDSYLQRNQLDIYDIDRDDFLKYVAPRFYIACASAKMYPFQKDIKLLSIDNFVLDLREFIGSGDR